jgi:hypothetical protein
MWVGSSDPENQSRANQKQDEVGALQVMAEFLFSRDTSIQIHIAPDHDPALTLQ